MRLKYYLQGAGVGIIVTTIVLAIIFAITPKEISDEDVIRKAEQLGMVMEETDVGAEPSVGDGAEEISPLGDLDALLSGEEPAENTGNIGDTENTENTESTENNENIENTTQTDNTADPGSTEEQNQADVQDGEESDGTSEPDAGEEAAAEPETEPDSETDTETDSNTETAAETETDVTPVGEDVVFVIRGGEVSQTVSDHLADAGLVDDADAFNDYLCDQRLDHVLQPGSYSLQQGMTYAQIARVLTKRG